MDGDYFKALARGNLYLIPMPFVFIGVSGLFNTMVNKLLELHFCVDIIGQVFPIMYI